MTVAETTAARSRVCCIFVKAKPARKNLCKKTNYASRAAFVSEFADLGSATQRMGSSWVWPLVRGEVTFPELEADNPSRMGEFHFECGEFDHTFRSLASQEYSFPGLLAVSREIVPGLKVLDYSTFGIFSLDREQTIIAGRGIKFEEYLEAVFCLHHYVREGQRVIVAYDQLAPWNSPIFEKAAERQAWVSSHLGLDAAALIHTARVSLLETPEGCDENTPIAYWLLGLDTQAKLQLKGQKVGFFADLRRAERLITDLRMVGIEGVEVEKVGSYLGRVDLFGIRLTVKDARRWVKLYEQWRENCLLECEADELAEIEQRASRAELGTGRASSISCYW